MATIAITGASGKLGGATLSALLAHDLVPASSIVALTSSSPGSPTWTTLAAKGVQVRHAAFEDPATFDEALRGVTKFFLVSTPHIELDFGDEDAVPDGKGREGHHRGAIDAAVRVGVEHIYYSSLAFAWDPSTKAPGSTSKAGVMRAHLRTEAYLKQLVQEGKLPHATFVREGLYNESWPLYLGYFDLSGSDNERTEVPLAGDGPICWTAISDLGVGSALVLVAPSAEYSGKTFYLSTRPSGARSVADIAKLVGEARGKDVEVKVVGRAEHERYYVEERGKEGPAVKWWSSTYAALEAGECRIDDPTLEKLLESVGVKATSVEECIAATLKGKAGSRIHGLQ
ncbi:NAD(P)-binding protein [Hypoxylon rubiginosum]|uniref:NAD(P)-binding protein n=1 Tax=Hypoxylon rubiginosum TaxID=110542 RepID=A0ACC0D866_9PEZI|nr:NAD(P)-binding protein [Hypoxylon rubiginosum]